MILIGLGDGREPNTFAVAANDIIVERPRSDAGGDRTILEFLDGDSTLGL